MTERNESPGKFSALLLTILVHLALIAFLVIGIRWQHQSAAGDGSMEVTLVAPATPSAPARRVEPPPEPPKPEPPKPEPEPEPEPEPPKPVPAPEPPKPAEKPADIALKKEPEKPKKEEPKPEPPKPKKEEPKKEPPKKKEEKKKEPPKPKEKSKPKVNEADYLNDLLNQATNSAAQDAEARKAAAALSGASAVAGGGNRGTNTDPGYADRIRQRVRSNLTLPPGVSGNPEGEFFVTQTPQGRVLSVRLARSTGDRALDDAIERAIRKSDPLPLPNSGEAERELLLRFRPLE